MASCVRRNTIKENDVIVLQWLLLERHSQTCMKTEKNYYLYGKIWMGEISQQRRIRL
jgi:hypothetical protein